MNNLFNLKSYIKFLGRNKSYTAIDVFGLSVSLMFVILIAVYVERELTIDKQQINSGRIVVVSNEAFMESAVPTSYWLQERYPEIEKVCPVITDQSGDRFPIFYEDKKLTGRMGYVDSTFFDVFSFRILDGDRTKVLEDPYSAVVSKSFARKVFADENPIGKSFRISDSTSVTVTGVMEDITRSIFPEFDFLVRIERVEEFNNSLSKTNPGNAGSCVSFLMLKPGADLQAKKDDILSFYKERYWIYQLGFYKEVHIVPFSEIYFNSIKVHSLEQGDRRFSLVLMSIGILILIFAIINYVNLTVAQAGRRAKEMATRRLLGSSRWEIFMRLMLEATLLTLVSFGIGLFFAVTALPFARDLLQVPITLEVLSTPVWVAAIIGFILLTGFLSGLIPALMISSAKPIDVVRGTFRRQTKMVFSKVFITFQNVITIAMIAASLTMYLQIEHLIHAPLGYNTTNIIETNNVFRSKSEMERAEDMLRQLPSVKEIGHTNGTPSSGTNNMSGTFENKSLSLQQMQVDSAAFRIFGIQIKSDNQVANPENGWYLNELALQQMGLPDDAPTFSWKGRGWNEDTPILGVIRDFRMYDITHDARPIMLRFRDPKNKWYPWQYIIEVQGDPLKAFNDVRNVFEEVSGIPFEGQYVDQGIRDHFGEQIRMAKIVVIFAGIAILISLLGLLAMSTYFIQQRAQEVAIRKVFGSDNQTVLFRLVGSFLVYVVLAFIISIPFIWYFMNQWLSDYSYRISLSPLIFMAAGLFCMVISFITVFFQSYKAANTNPVESVSSR